jgi:hypothetical protein
MPSNTGSRLQRVCACFVVMVGPLAPLNLAEAALNPRLNPDGAREAAPLVYGIPEGEVSLTGFQCDIISEEDAAAFAADPDDSETPPTVGLELVLDTGGFSALAASGHAGRDDISSAEMKNPLSARLSRIIVGHGSASLNDGGVLEEVSLPEASMSVADLLERCRP